MKLLLFITTAVISALSFSPLLAQDDAGLNAALGLQRRVQNVFEDNKLAVVKVISAFNTENEDAKNVLLVGTGFYISKEGHIMTNTNVVYGADRIWIEREGIAYVCEAVGHDPLTNISIIQALTLPSDFEFLRFSEKPDLPAVGSFLLSITCELGMQPGPSFGLISGWNTQYVERILPTIYLRTDIPYDGGEGGAPVFDLNGSLVGMIVAALPEIRSSLVLPARAIQRVRDDILFSGQVTYAYFGFQTRQTSSLASGPWVEVEDVQKDSPADTAGILKGDILKQVGDFEIKTDDDLRTASFFTRPDEFVTIYIIRGDKEMNLEMKPSVREVPITAMPPAHAQAPMEADGPFPVGADFVLPTETAPPAEEKATSEEDSLPDEAAPAQSASPKDKDAPVASPQVEKAPSDTGEES
ncbi:S1C family serine protease [Rubellicoccus peritrichatus]|uniref:Trypsin-like peptidase domain-containing protein n=1 Tax=Rubellicoccus peritrichatus TaxID=3080537 RepID=A0AAQ3QV35_9BACT|nr:trypsin-like peptidase domain-containing protein [Puniceicoccus sp. CR14]WOO41103.1 trypsin-like peptidase domain-containing protein [Puniceicoccus sp. CR14]